MADQSKPISPTSLPPSGNQLYQSYDLVEETIRSSYHYELDPEFFHIVIGGEWHTYSAFLWEDGFSATQAQERKLDTLAELMSLKPGMRILDVGCGWGGPLVYLCRKYGATGHGVSVTPGQIVDALARAARYGVDATFEVSHWQNLPAVETYDVVYTDEVMVHFHDLDGFFAKCRQILKPGQLMVHKELHLTHSSMSALGPLSQHVNKVYAYTGNYIPLHEELKLLDQNGFRLERILDIPMSHYQRTLDCWLDNMFENRDRLHELAGHETYREFRLYLKAMRYLFARVPVFGLHVVASRRID